LLASLAVDANGNIAAHGVGGDADISADLPVGAIVLPREDIRTCGQILERDVPEHPLGGLGQGGQRAGIEEQERSN
jgi:hypothetical protein